MSGLVTFFSKLQEVNCGFDLLSQAVSAYLKGEERGEALLFSLIEGCENLPLETPENVTDFYQALVAILFMEPSGVDQKIEALIAKGKVEGFWNSFPLHKGYQSLAEYLFCGKCDPFEVKQLERGGVLQEGEMHAFERHIPNPQENGLLALVCLYLGWALKNEELIQKGIKLTEFCLSLCDAQGELFEGLWVKESQYKNSKQQEVFALLFSVVNHIVLSSKMQMIAENFFEKRQGKDPFISLFAKGFQNLIDAKVSVTKIHEGITLYDQDQSLGYVRYQTGNLSLACSASGVNTGLGTLHKGGIHITSFGPHYPPLADSNYYGIFRPSNGSREGFKDITIESEEERVRFKGWTRVIENSSTSPGAEWLFFDIEGEGEKIHLKTRRSQCEEISPLYFVFFVTAEKVQVGEREFFPKALDRFRGKCHKILFERGEEKMIIDPHFNGEMEVIPLAGREHFWSADFLLAFPMREKMCPYSWNVE
ncbi:MAG: hypothetical protein KDK76_00945 [Chlamydiia bacterium]|nr:hypothetical protein [Chlamydiia bacterium]